jgi:3-(3-hydroxy-phenyl)propionate hydroxylase
VSRTDTDVVILGGGPVGCLLSVLLGDAGVRSAVVERDAQPYSLPRAIVMDDEIQRVLRLHGMGGFLDDRTEPMAAADFVDADGATVIGLDIPATGLLGLPPVVVHYQPELDAMLRREVEARGADARWGRTVADVREDGDGVLTSLDDGSEIRSRWFVGCDGASSWTRKRFGLSLDDLQFDQDWVVVDVELHEDASVDLPRGVRQYCEPARPSTYVKGVRRFRRWEFQVQPGEVPADLATDEALWSLLSRWLTPRDARLVRSATYRFHAVVAPTMRAGRAFLAGDAAHQMPPFAGQGLNSGMRDAVNLAWKMGMVSSGCAGDALLDSYSVERVPHVRRTVASSVDMGRLIDQIAGHVSHGVGVDAGYGGDAQQPFLEDGLVVHGDPRAGRQFWHHVGVEQASVRRGGSFVVVAGSDDAAVPPSLGALPTELVVAPEAANGAFAVVVRPDLFVAGVAVDQGGLDAIGRAIASRAR